MASGTPPWISSALSYEKHICLIGLITNSFHLIVLVQKEMRTSSTNIILLGIAVSDIYYTGHPVVRYIKDIIQSIRNCTPTSSYISTYLFQIANAVRDDSERCTMLLGLSMALIRLIVMRNPLKYDHLTSAKIGWKTVFLMSIFSSTISFCYWLRSDVREFSTLRPNPRTCDLASFPENYTWKSYGLVISELDKSTGFWLSKVYVFVDGLISKIIPAVLFPVFTVFLVCQLQKIAATRDRMFSDNKNEKNRLTTRLVIYNSVSFMISGVPLGLLYVAQSVCTSYECQNDAFNLLYLCELFICANTISHFLICNFVSSQYQKTVRMLLRIKEKEVVVVEVSETR